MNESIKAEVLALREKRNIAYVGSVNEEGFPQIKAMMVPEHKSTQVQYFSTNTSSKRVKQFMKNPNASVYYCDDVAFKGALFTGTISVCTDHDTKASIWREGDEKYYPQGIDDDDYCVLKFTATTVNYYHGLQNHTFPVADLL